MRILFSIIILVLFIACQYQQNGEMVKFRKWSFYNDSVIISLPLDINNVDSVTIGGPEFIFHRFITSNDTSNVFWMDINDYSYYPNLNFSYASQVEKMKSKFFSLSHNNKIISVDEKNEIIKGYKVNFIKGHFYDSVYKINMGHIYVHTSLKKNIEIFLRYKSKNKNNKTVDVLDSIFNSLSLK